MTEATMSEATCTVDGCDLPVKRKRLGLCYGHYMKHWRYGDVHHEHEHPPGADLTGQRFGALVVVAWEPDGRVGKWVCACDCGATTRVRTGDLNAGNVASCGDRATHSRLPVVGYWAAHDRLDRDRGPAKTHACIGCDDRAAEWSYDHTDPNPLWLETPQGSYPYSLDPERYGPRCVRCHRRFDGARIAA